MDNSKFTPILPSSAQIQTEICRKSITQELSQDYTLPDYQPEIRKLHRIEVNILPPTQFVGSDGAEFSGTLDYSLLYSDNDGKLCLAVISDDYSFSAPFEKNQDGTDLSLDPELVCFADVSCESVSARATAPRKLALRCRLRAKVSAFGSDSPECEIFGDTERGSIERLEGVVNANRVIRGESDVVLLSGEIVSDSNSSAALSGGSELRIIAPEVHVFISEASVSDGYITCRGDAIVKLLLCRENPDGDPFSVTKKLPFSVTVDMDGVDSECSCRAFGRVHDVTVSNDEGRIICEVGVSAVAEAQANIPLRYVKDIYSTASLCQCSVKEISYPTAGRCFSGNFTSGGSVSLSELGIDVGSVLLDCSASAPSIDSVALEKSKYVVTGICKYSLLMILGAEIFSKECSLPFRYEADAKGMLEECEYEACADVISVRCRSDGEKAVIDSELFVSVRTFGKVRINAVTEASFESVSSNADTTEASESAFTVCYPDKDDTLWSVAKRYRTELEGLMRRNSLSVSGGADTAESLRDVKFLII